MSDNNDNDHGLNGDRDKMPLSIKDLIPGSRLAVLGSDLYASDPTVSEGDDVYEVNLTGDGGDDVNGRHHRPVEPAETWTSPEIERAFLRCIMGG